VSKVTVASLTMLLKESKGKIFVKVFHKPESILLIRSDTIIIIINMSVLMQPIHQDSMACMS
jgi:hypothetical protein